MLSHICLTLRRERFLLILSYRAWVSFSMDLRTVESLWLDCSMRLIKMHSYGQIGYAADKGTSHANAGNASPYQQPAMRLPAGWDQGHYSGVGGC